ncbi:MAG: glycosyltransferase family 4 protein [Fidelibacterota bacterium]|nr:MAG: glycosyltransferase family 4 protein [Candidatus Neomarinimicrobiota bacterium]
MRILLITQYFPPELGAAAQRIDSLARFLSKRAQVSVLAPIPSYPWGAIQKSVRSIGGSVETNGVSVFRIYKSPHRRNFLLRLLGELLYAILGLTSAWQLPKPDVVFISSPSFFLGMIGLVLKRLKKIDYVFDVRDYYPDSAVDAGVLREGLLYRLMKRLERAIYTDATLVSVVLETWQSEIESSAKKVVVVPNGIDLDKFRGESSPLTDHLPPDKLTFLENHFIVLYPGNLGKLQDNLTFLKVAGDLVRKGNNHIQFVFLGEGLEKENLMAWVRRENVSNCHFWDPVPSEAVPEIIRRADIGIVGLKRHLRAYSGGVPSKVYEYLAGDLDVIACLEGDLPNDLLESGKFFVFDNTDIDGIVKKILDLKSAGEKSHTSGELLEKMSRAKHFERLWAVIQARA